MSARRHARVMLSARAAKAYVAAAVAGLGCLAPAAVDGIELAELLTAAGVALVGFQGTYWVTNSRRPVDDEQGDPAAAWHGPHDGYAGP